MEWFRVCELDDPVGTKSLIDAADPEDAVYGYLMNQIHFVDDMFSVVISVEDESDSLYFYQCIFYDRGNYGEWEVERITKEEALFAIN